MHAILLHGYSYLVSTLLMSRVYAAIDIGIDLLIVLYTSSLHDYHQFMLTLE
jgi:hypothetical protein